MIAAMASNRIVGKNNQLPRHYSEDLRYFKSVTLNHTIVMGYNTFLSIGKPLPQRRNIVLSKTPIEWVETYTSIEEMLQTLSTQGEDEIFVIGWVSMYTQFLPRTDKIYLTEIKQPYEGDVSFPLFENEFEEIQRIAGEEMDFVVYQRKNKANRDQ